MRVLITGSTGFIGKHVLSILEKNGHDILALMRSSDHISRSKVRVLNGSLDSLEDIKGAIKDFSPEACIHLAWSGIPDFSLSMCMRNVENSIGFLNFLATETSCQKWVISGSCFEYGVKEGICTEDQVAVINTLFSWAKHTIYNYARIISEAKKIEMHWLRFFYVYGPGQRGGSLIPTIIQSLKNKQCPPIQNPFNANDFVDVEDVANAIIVSLQSKGPSGVYNVGSGQTYRVLEICTMAEKILYGNEELTQPLHRCESVPSTNFWADTQKAKRVLGWKSQISLQQGIHNYIDSLEAV